MKRGEINARYVMLRRSEAMEQLPIICEEKQARGVFIESSHRRHLRVAVVPSLGEKLIDQFSLFAMRADESSWLVHQDEKRFWIKRFCINLDERWIDFRINFFNSLAIGRDFVMAHKALRLRTRAVSAAGEDAIETKHSLRPLPLRERAGGEG